MRSKILIIVFFLNTSVFSQNFFSIQLLSKRDSTAIPYAFMRVLSNYQLLQADSLGVFNFSLKTIQEEVILSSVGFYSKKLVVIPDITKIYLDEKTEELNEVDILVEKKNEFFNSDSLDVIDLEINNGFWILAQNTAKPIRKYIFYLDYNQQLVAKQNVNNSFLKLERLCNDELFVGNKDSLYQVNYLSDKIVLNFPVANNFFDDLNRDCVIKDKNRIVKVKYEFLQLRSLFVLRTKYADSINEKIIFKVEDSLTTRQLREQYSTAYITRYKSKNKWFNYSIEDVAKNKDKYIVAIRQHEYKDRTPLPKIKLAYYYFDKNFFIYDFSNGNIYRFDSDLRFLEKIKLQDKGIFYYSPLCMVDEVTGSLFCFYQGRGGEMLRQYDRFTGKIISEKKIKNDFKLMGRVIRGKLYFKVNKNSTSNYYNVQYIELD